MNADHNGLRGWVQATQHTASFWQGNYTRAATYAADGLRYATGAARTFLTSAYAVDLACDRQPQPAQAALAHARDAADSAEPDDEIGGPFTGTRDRAASLWSDTHLASLGYSNSPGPAEPIADALARHCQHTTEVTVSTVSLINLNRDHKAYEWVEVATVPLGRP